MAAFRKQAAPEQPKQHGAAVKTRDIVLAVDTSVVRVPANLRHCVHAPTFTARACRTPNTPRTGWSRI